MRRRISWIAAVVAMFSVVWLTGCGSKNADSIVKDLDKVVGKMESYEGSGTMTLHTGQQPLEYKVEVWYQKPKLYRIALTNAKRDITQIVLRNDEGVFVLTPQLNKSYRFQSEWPENQGQVYLFQTLAQSIIRDEQRQFATEKDNYVFDVMAGNYQNGSFARQKIWLSQDNLAPKQVQVTDSSGQTMVDVKFDTFVFGKKFDKSAFDMDKNMGIEPKANAKPSDHSAEGSPSPGATSSPAPDASASASPGEDDETSVQPEQPTDQPAAVPTLDFIEPDPDALPKNVTLKDQTTVQLGENEGIMARYSGDYDFTIVESIAKDRAVTLSEGIVLDLGFTMAHLTRGESSTLTWTYGGVDYRISSADLNQDDMVRIAQSMEQSSGK
ncbi:DUF4367 domain-containing protein [Cohnella soli]|uniref:DUF4367 domain-containing protein n=1 Tax=Cohnella soli TaxID=425005 RepID=A0ABW0HXS2_9BACL